jgi:putative ABC transport system ATP-binding protein
MGGSGVGVVARGLWHSFAGPDGPLEVLRDVHLQLPPGGYCSLQGPSGSGKTTLLSLLGGLERPQEGTVQVGDVDLGDLAGDALAEYRRTTVGFVFQHYGLLETLTAQENVELASALAGHRRSVRRRRAAELLDSVGLGPRAKHRPAQLSGGERQRVAMARAMANGPRLLLADESTGNLDEESASRVLGLLETLQEASGCTLLVVTHDHRLAARARSQLCLSQGTVVVR